MSISLRRHRAAVFAFQDLGSAGESDMAYLIIPSSAPDQQWWCARTLPHGDERTVGAAPEHRVDAVLELSAACPLDLNSAIVLFLGTAAEETYMVRAILRRDYGRDTIEVQAERVWERALTTS